MTLRCKPGNLAIVIGALKTPEAIGRIVEVVSVAVAGDIYECHSGRLIRLVPTVPGPFWRVRDLANAMPWRTRDGTLELATYAACPDAWLRPVSGLPIDEETHDEVPA